MSRVKKVRFCDECFSYYKNRGRCQTCKESKERTLNGLNVLERKETKEFILQKSLKSFGRVYARNIKI